MPALLVSIVAFVLGFVGSMPLAGPISVMVVSRSAERRYREARHLAFGAAAAEAMYALLAFWGFATFLARHRAILPVSHAVTAAVLLLVGVHFVRWKGAHDDCKQGEARKSPFVLGFSLSALNPTLFATWSVVTTALYSRQIVPMTGLLAVPFGIAAGAGVAAWNVALVAVLKRFANSFPRRAVTWTVRGMGLLMIAVAVWSAVDLVRHVLRPSSGGEGASAEPAVGLVVADGGRRRGRRARRRANGPRRREPALLEVFVARGFCCERIDPRQGRRRLLFAHARTFVARGLELSSLDRSLTVGSRYRIGTARGWT